MTETIKVNKLKNEVPTNQQQPAVEKIITLKGFTTSRVEQALKGSKTQGQSPYPARVFLKEDCATCLSEKRQCFHSYPTTDTPIIFRIRCRDWLKTGSCCPWTKPSIKKGSYLTLRGIFADLNTGSPRKSFTAYSYQILEEDYLAKKEVLDQAKDQLPEFEQAYQQIKQVRQQLESHE